MTFNTRIFVASIFNIAEKGCFKIKTENNVTVLKRRSSNQKLTKPEKLLMSIFLRKNVDTFEFSLKNDTIITYRLTLFKTSIDREVNAKYFLHNFKYYIVGSLTTILVLWIADVFPAPNFLYVFKQISIMFCVFVFALRSLPKREDQISNLVFYGMYGYVFVGFTVSMFFSTTTFTVQFVIDMVLIIAMFVLNILFTMYSRQYTQEGQDLLNQIDGFIMFLKATEQEKYKMLGMIETPEYSSTLFEKYLPYAIAFGIENKWSAQFHQAFFQENYNPEWIAIKMKPGGEEVDDIIPLSLSLSLSSFVFDFKNTMDRLSEDDESGN